jgi:hypothetical protein
MSGRALAQRLSQQALGPCSSEERSVRALWVQARAHPVRVRSVREGPVLPVRPGRALQE